MLRWLLLVCFGLVGVAAAYLHVVAHPTLGRGLNRALGVGLGVLAVWAVVGLALRASLGWYAAIGLSAYSVIEGGVAFGRGPATRPRGALAVITAAFALLNLALIAFLLSTSGRVLFGL
jgi:hypothetical protein